MMRTMPFGKFRGTPIRELPDDYINWLLSLDDLRDPLAGAIAAEHNRRVFGAPRSERADTPLQNDCPSRETAQKIIDAGFRSVATKAHPDRGGTHEQMVLTNAVVAWLRQFVRGGGAE